MMVQVDISTCTIAGRVIQPASMFVFCYDVQHNVTIKTLRRGEYPVALRLLTKVVEIDQFQFLDHHHSRGNLDPKGYWEQQGHQP